MTGKKFLLFSFLQWLLLAVLKYWFFTRQILDNQGWQSTLLWILTAIIIVALTRRFGVLNFLEVLFLMFFWTVGNLFLDLAIVSNFTGTSIFYKTDYWGTFVVMIVGIFIFHKKRHIHVRHEMQAKAHAAKHAHSHSQPKH